ncbi:MULTISPECIES: DpnD/PcfM family protein [Psychrobacter]|uniref:DpnD/PcfM family protein n=3 Tax=Moraxellaceae TaxID=468 RepID=UPI0018DEF137|nr:MULTISPECIES: DpnD/PcfM family protein [Psychrobacter]WLW66517.1 DpnD/PcfM family protein [Psychrobacter sp. van23A]
MMKNDKNMEKVFQIEVVETLSNLVKISAEDEQGALLKAQELYRNEDVVLYPDNLIDTKFNIL